MTTTTYHTIGRRRFIVIRGSRETLGTMPLFGTTRQGGDYAMRSYAYRVPFALIVVCTARRANYWRTADGK